MRSIPHRSEIDELLPLSFTINRLLQMAWYCWGNYRLIDMIIQPIITQPNAWNPPKKILNLMPSESEYICINCLTTIWVYQVKSHHMIQDFMQESLHFPN